jgi:hypothetical protein
MKRVFCIVTLIFCINILSYSQIIEESIPKFAEKLLTLTKSSAENNITNRGFRVLTSDELISLGYDEESLVNLIVGFGDKKITCKIQTNNTGRYIEKVTVGGVRYLNARYMANEYLTAGYIMDEEKSRGNEMIFVKQTDKYNYFAFIEFMVNPNMCMANATFKRVARK